MREENDPGAFLPQVRDSRQGGTQPRSVRHPPIPQGNVEIDAHQRALAVQGLWRQVAQGALGQRRRPMVASRSTERAQYPLSLSYHDDTWTSVPSITAVDIASTTLE